MRELSIVDCTLRDGGYINQWKFGNHAIKDIVCNLGEANIDIIECGFLRDIQYDKDASVFSCVSQILPLITPKSPNTLYVAMIAYGDISPDKILPYDGSSIDGIRLSFHRNQWAEAKKDAIQLKEKGYKLFLQPVGTTAYTDKALLDLIEDINEIRPYCFHLVDTLGVMYRNDLLRFYYLIDHNLAPDIRLGFHSHNNLQLSFANAQELIRQDSKRALVIDTSVFGMGRGVGNLATELMAEYINVNIDQRYVITPLLSIADNHLMSIYAEQRWGYDLPYFLSADYNCHPNYAAYLLKKGTITIPMISKLLSLLPDDEKDLYNKTLIENIYLKYQNCQFDDQETIKLYARDIANKNVLLLAPGITLNTEKDKIEEYISLYQPVIISVNSKPSGYNPNIVFFSNQKRAEYFASNNGLTDRILATSNIQNILRDKSDYINYADYLGEGANSDNAGAMLIRFLRKTGAKSVALAGFDGFDVDASKNYSMSDYKNVIYMDDAKEKNADISRQLKHALGSMEFTVLTTTRYII